MKKYPLTTLALNILSVLLLILGSIQLWQASTYIMDSITQGYTSWSTDGTTIISYISQACTTPFCFSIIFYVLGKMYSTQK